LGRGQKFCVCLDIEPVSWHSYHYGGERYII
jgi:hypothetical protein